MTVQTKDTLIAVALSLLITTIIFTSVMALTHR